MRRLSAWTKTWIVIAVLVAAFSTFAIWGIYDFGQASTGVAAKWDRPTSPGTMVFITLLGLFVGAIVLGCAVAAEWLWRAVHRSSN